MRRVKYFNQYLTPEYFETNIKSSNFNRSDYDEFCICKMFNPFKINFNDKIIALKILKSFFLFLTLRLV